MQQAEAPCYNILPEQLTTLLGIRNTVNNYKFRSIIVKLVEIAQGIGAPWYGMLSLN